MHLDDLQYEYDQGFLWRGAWLALANKSEPNRLQSKQERIEGRAAIANARVGRSMRSADILNANASIEHATISPELDAAMKTILRTLPQGAQIRFYWEDGVQQLCMSLPGQPDQLVRSNSEMRALA